MITHTRPAVEPAPTLADYPTTLLNQLAEEAAAALRIGSARLAWRVHCSPATLRDIRDNIRAEVEARGEIQTRAARLHNQRGQWLDGQGAFVLGDILDKNTVEAIPYALRDVITMQTLRDKLHRSAAADYANHVMDQAKRDAYRQQVAWYQNGMDQSCYDDPAVRAAIHTTIRQQAGMDQVSTPLETGCEGHYGEDQVLTSDNPGGPMFCDGSCQQ